MLGLLLARAGVQVTVLEKHGDFLRDFRGSTVHASTLTVLDELGLGEEFDALLMVRYIESLTAQLDAGEVPNFRPALAAGTSQAHRPGAAMGLPRSSRQAWTARTWHTTWS